MMMNLGGRWTAALWLVMQFCLLDQALSWTCPGAAQPASRARIGGVVGFKKTAAAGCGGVVGLVGAPHLASNEMAARRIDRHRVTFSGGISMAGVARDTLGEGIEYGDTGGAMLAADSVWLTAGERDILTDVSWKVNQDERVGLVGPNGAGKSTLLAAIAGRRPLWKGSVRVKPGVTLGYLEQTAVGGSTRSVYDESEDGMVRIKEAEARLKEATELCEREPENKNAAQELSDATMNLIQVGGDNKEAKVIRVLDGLGFVREDYNKSCADLSGGWQMRVALAKLLLSEPDLLLLDEPTNHLDAKAKGWLMGYLKQYEGTVVLVTHEEALLSMAGCNSIVEVRDKGLVQFRCSYEKFLVERQERVAQAEKAYLAQQEEREKLQGYIDRFGSKASKAASAQSRQKQLDKMEVLEAPQGLREGKAKVKLQEGPKTMHEVVRLDKATFGWEEDRPILQDVDLILERGMRLVIVGPNGAGKSTLLWALAEKLKLQKGKRRESEGLQMGVFTQDLAQELPSEAVAMDEVMRSVQEIDPSVTVQQVRDAMGNLGLSGPKALQPIYTLSGGEKARVALSCLVLIKNNLLLLDEPSNHLDRATLEALTEALQTYKGTVAVVTHNKVFCEEFKPTHTAIVKDGKVELLDRAVKESDWAMIEAAEREDLLAAASAAAKLENKAAKQLSFADNKRRGNAPKRIQKIEAQVEKIEALMADLDRQMMECGSDYGRVDELQKNKEAEEKKLEELYAEWEELEELMAS